MHKRFTNPEDCISALIESHAGGFYVTYHDDDCGMQLPVAHTCPTLELAEKKALAFINGTSTQKLYINL